MVTRGYPRRRLGFLRDYQDHHTVEGLKPQDSSRCWRASPSTLLLTSLVRTLCFGYTAIRRLDSWASFFWSMQQYLWIRQPHQNLASPRNSSPMTDGAIFGISRSSPTSTMAKRHSLTQCFGRPTSIARSTIWANGSWTRWTRNVSAGSQSGPKTPA